MNVEVIQSHVASILLELGEKPREGLADTPKRYAKFLREFLTRPELRLTVFVEEGADEMVHQQGISFAALCEHHMLPFFGTASVAYIPDGKHIIGLSKLARIVEHHSAALTNQERITREIAATIMKTPGLNAVGVGVSLRAVHTCMSIRGVKAHGAYTETRFLDGVFSTDSKARSEFLNSVKHPPIGV